MQVQTLKIKIEEFEPKDLFECGQCFRWNKDQNGSYIGVFNENVIEVKKQKDEVFFQGICKNEIKEVVNEYFDLSRDYNEIQETLSKVDQNLKTSIAFGRGIRILNQPLWETLMSFIISANNNIPRIKKIIESLAKNYGTPLNYQGKTYYKFPTVKQLSKVGIEEFRQNGLGFRDRYIYGTTQMLIKQPELLKKIENLSTTEEMRNQLMKFPGVGEKVADCVLLFSTLKRLDVFPIDVWVKRVMNDLYFKEDEKQIDKKKIYDFAKANYKELAGIAQQYLFYWKREA